MTTEKRKRQQERQAATKAYLSRRIAKDEGHCESCRWMPPRSALGVVFWGALNVHHVIPVARGGDDGDENLILLCANCHAIAHRVGNCLGRVYRGPRTKADLLKALADVESYKSEALSSSLRTVADLQAKARVSVSKAREARQTKRAALAAQKSRREKTRKVRTRRSDAKPKPTTAATAITEPSWMTLTAVSKQTGIPLCELFREVCAGRLPAYGAEKRLWVDPDELNGYLQTRNDAQDLLTVEDAAKYLRVSIPVLRREILKGRIPVKKTGQDWTFSRRALRSYVSGEPLPIESNPQGAR